MKYTMIYATLLFAFGCAAQEKDSEKLVKTTIMDFAKAADENDTEKLTFLLDNNFRIAMNQMFGSTEVQTVDKSYYLSKISSKEWGGDKRKVTIENLTIVGKNAAAKVTLAGEKSTMISLLTMVMDAEGVWRILADIPTMG